MATLRTLIALSCYDIVPDCKYPISGSKSFELEFNTMDEFKSFIDCGLVAGRLQGVLFRFESGPIFVCENTIGHLGYVCLRVEDNLTGHLNVKFYMIHEADSYDPMMARAQQEFDK